MTANHLICSGCPRREPRKPNYGILIPLIYAPLLPLSTPLPSMLHMVILDQGSLNSVQSLPYWRDLFVIVTVRIGLKGRVSPGARDAIFGGAVLTALAHAGYVRPLHPTSQAASMLSGVRLYLVSTC